jgi:chromosome segregation ATPase
MGVDETLAKVKSAIDDARAAHAQARAEAGKTAAESESSDSAVKLIERSLVDAQERAAGAKRDAKLAADAAKAREASLGALETLSSHLRAITEANAASESLKKTEALGRPASVLEPMRNAVAARKLAADEAEKKLEAATRAVSDAEGNARKAAKALESARAVRGEEKQLEDRRTHLANVTKKLDAYKGEVEALKQAIEDHEKRVADLKAAFEKPADPGAAPAGGAPPAPAPPRPPGG